TGDCDEGRSGAEKQALDVHFLTSRLNAPNGLHSSGQHAQRRDSWPSVPVRWRSFRPVERALAWVGRHLPEDIADEIMDVRRDPASYRSRRLRPTSAAVAGHTSPVIAFRTPSAYASDGDGGRLTAIVPADWLW